MTEIVSATQLPQKSFGEWAPLDQSPSAPVLRQSLHLEYLIRKELGLPEVFNARIEAPDQSEILIFVHDEVWIDDFFLLDCILQGLSQFDVIGLAGNRNRVPRQPSWIFKEIVNGQFVKYDDKNLSDAVAHGPCPLGVVSPMVKSQRNVCS